MCLYLFRIRVRYGPNVWTPVRGGSGGKLSSVELEPGELIRAVYLSTDQYHPNPFITSHTAPALCKITFLTNGKIFGPYGSCSKDNEKSFLFPHGIFYFSGGSTKYLNELEFNSLCPYSKIIAPTRGIDY